MIFGNNFLSDKYILCIEDGEMHCTLVDKSDAEEIYNELKDEEYIKVYVAKVIKFKY